LVGISPSTFYYHRSKPQRADSYALVRPLIREVFDNAYRSYGYRRLKAVLATKHGLHVSGKTVLRLMREESRFCQVRRKKYRSYRGEVGLAAPNVLERDFQASKPNQKWATDVTEFKVLGQKQYFSPVIDLFNGEVISYELKSRPVLSLVTEMLDKAFMKLEPGQKPILHSDQGWHYRHLGYQRALTARGLTQSMSRKGNCLDNAVAENFFGHFKEEFLRQSTFTSMKQFKAELDAYIHWFNNDRIRLKLKGLSPVNYRTQSLARIPTDSYLNVQ
jgi:transposase InsO family protein